MQKMKSSGVPWIGEIPEGWSTIRLKHTCTITTGNKDTVNRVENGQYPFYVRSPNVERIDTFTFEGEAILMAGDGVGAGRVFHYANGKFDYHQRVYNLHDFKNIYARFLFYYLENNFWKEIEQSNAKSTVDSIRLPMLLNFPVCLASFSQQQRIADFLDEKCTQIDDTIAKEKELIAKLKEYRQSIITEAVTKGLNPTAPMKDSGIDWIGEIPKHWEVRKLRFLGTCQNGISKAGDFFGKGSPFITYSDCYKSDVIPLVASGLIESTKNEQDTYSVQKGDIFFTRTSETVEEIALSSVCLSDMPNATFAGFLIRMRPNFTILNEHFSKYYFRNGNNRQFFTKEMNLVTRASLGQELLKKLPVLLPPLQEQQEISAYLDKKTALIDNTIQQKEQLIEKLNQYKKSLIYEAVTGKIEV